MKVGDKVAVLNSQGIVIRITHIERETRLYWIVAGEQYRKDSLTSPGKSWFHNTIEPLTQKHLDEIKKFIIVQKLSTTKWEKLDLETLENIFATVCGMTETKETEK